MIKKPLFLVVEDDEDDRELLTMACQEGPYPCDLVFAENGKKAIELLEKINPSVILLDINMPRMNGLELLTELKSSEKWKSMPILMLTTSDSKSLILDAYDLGANSYVVKPNSYQALSKVWENVYKFWANTIQLPTL
ncbi:MAG: response regulator [Siphonobacter sp.]